MFLDAFADFSTARLLFLGVGGLAGLLGVETRPASPPLALETSAPGARRALLAGPFEAQALRVVDGDTFEARVRIWIGQDIQVLVRLRGVDAPELAARCGREGRRAVAARERLAMLLSAGALSLRDVGLDKYGGRIVAAATVTDDAAGSEDVASLMLASGHARAYSGARRASWCAPKPDETADGLDHAAAPEAPDAVRASNDQSPPSFPSLSAQR